MGNYLVRFWEGEFQIKLSFIWTDLLRLQAAHGKTLYNFNLLLSESSSAAYSASQGFWLSGWLNSINNIFLTIGPGDFLVHSEFKSAPLIQNQWEN